MAPLKLKTVSCNRQAIWSTWLRHVNELAGRCDATLSQNMARNNSLTVSIVAFHPASVNFGGPHLLHHPTTSFHNLFPFSSAHSFLHQISYCAFIFLPKVRQPAGDSSEEASVHGQRSTPLVFPLIEPLWASTEADHRASSCPRPNQTWEVRLGLYVS
ncbi:hypothetical protein EVAR_18314_1 [Eumeta japonica]|uniref:Uncharacterized protein n=1 Tax=Eumeta variegata TaxID=151549 RepID=A0A4C1V925_EUMVA|nr:hypothetical protein EVAR_18314_1 [Eumeta japonica]